LVKGYLAGALFFVRVITEKKWQRVQAGFLPITVFTIAMMAATLLHWERFHQGTFIFYFWTVIYAVTPLLVPFLWWRNRARDPHTLEENDVQFSTGARWILGAAGTAGVLLGVAAFFSPAIFISITPWKLTELTARIFAGWSLLSFSTVLSVARVGRWSATRFLVQSVILGQGLTLFALPRMWNDFDPNKPMTYVFVGGLIVSLVGLVITYYLLERKSRRR
jgi:MFS family permease